MNSVILFSFFSVAVLAAVIMIFYNRHRARSSYSIYREPHLNLNPQSEELNESDENSEDNAVEEYAVVIDRASAAQSNILNEPEVQSDDLTSESNYDAPSKRNESPARSKISSDEIVVINIMAKLDRPYAGYELLQALLSAGMRFGKMQIFHRYKQLNGAGLILFSLASAAKPGTFDIPKMGGFVTPGLTLFMRTSDSDDAVAAFDLMLETAKQLTEDLGGDICDQQRQPLNEEKIAEIRASLLTYVQAQQSEDLFPA